ncbi:hypothetical protein PTSG_08034 [Salpingoeca rosetta]|uniref:LRRK2 ARM repeat domain-containing protein n=1 Tax=Salpingoeca rosetta (strain ATCC 50818 / BSB-021) TaxID=946362 RepID=F2UHT4_SALR5|nr:uncharacterized protein PTSG_08034 [Salpingoeca rosetta]EGD76683.1 hypothetical protein PTSG_08034 [Salpingoeca rosetta]|eukprot:XP_004991055.1 hypothetical protein PTSG_08034 [Salpingoeca rosetta]
MTSPLWQCLSDGCDVCISFEQSEALEESKALHAALCAHGNVTAFLCDASPGANTAASIVEAIDTCKLVVIMGTSAYGAETGSPINTNKQLWFVVSNNKPLIVVKMCDAYATPHARFHLASGVVPTHEWRLEARASLHPHPPPRLVDAIVARIRAMHTPQATTSSHGLKAITYRSSHNNESNSSNNHDTANSASTTTTASSDDSIRHDAGDADGIATKRAKLTIAATTKNTAASSHHACTTTPTTTNTNTNNNNNNNNNNTNTNTNTTTTTTSSSTTTTNITTTSTTTNITTSSSTSSSSSSNNNNDYDDAGDDNNDWGDSDAAQATQPTTEVTLGEDEQDAIHHLEQNGANTPAVDIVKTMTKTFSYSAAVQQACCAALAKQAQASEAKRAAGAAAGAVDALLSAMRRHAGSARVQAQACCALQKLALNSGSTVCEIVGKGGIDVVLRAMQAKRKAKEVQQQGCHVLALIASENAVNKRTIAVLGGVGVLLRVMRKCTLANVRERACAALMQLSLHDGNQQCIADEGGIDVVMRVMLDHKPDADIQRWGWRVLGEVATSSPDSAQTIANTACRGALLLCAIGTNCADARHCAAALRALTQVVQRIGNEPLLRTFCSDNMMGLLLRAMGVHGDNADVYAYGCMLLAALAEGDDKHDKMQVTITRNGGVDVILSAMKSHSSNAEVVENALGALNSLCFDAHSATAVASKGGTEAVLEAMKQYRCEQPVQEQGCSVLSRIANHNNISFATTQHAADAVLAAMHVFIDDGAVQAQACSTLTALARDNAIAATVAGKGAVACVVLAMQRHSTDPEVQTPACEALWSMAYDSKAIKKKVATAGGMDTVVAAMKTHRNNEKVVWTSCSAVAALCEGATSTTRALAKSGAVAAVLAAMVALSVSVNVQKRACETLVLLSAYWVCRKEAFAQGGVDVVLDAMKRFANNGDMQGRGCEALGALAGNSYERRTIADKGGIDVALAAMRTHKSDRHVQSEACVMMGAIATDRAVAQRIQASEFPQLCYDAYTTLDGLSFDKHDLRAKGIF